MAFEYLSYRQFSNTVETMVKALGRTVLSRKIRQWRRILFRNDDPQLGVNEILMHFSCKTELSERMESLRQLVSWFLADGTTRIEVRLRFFLKALESSSARKDQFAQALDLTIRQCTFFRFFTSVGLTVEHGLWGDIAGRLLAKILSEGTRHDFIRIALEAFQDESLVPNSETISREMVQKVGAIIFESLSQEARIHLIKQRRDAIYSLATHIAHYGLSSAIQRRVEFPNVISGSPFFSITAAIRNENVEVTFLAIEECERELASVYHNMEHSGVSVDVVNRLETVEELLFRLKLLLNTLSAKTESKKIETTYQFICEVASAGIRARSVMGHLARHFYLMSRKVTERNGHSGEHYIARNKSELKGLFLSAIGGGFIVVAMTFFKTLFIQTEPPPLFMALGIWIIYGCGFLGMQLSGATLATKIPSFTASKLASFLNSSTNIVVGGFRQEVRQVVKSQFVALLGNICGVIPLVLLVNYLLKIIFGFPVLMDEKFAHYVLDGLHPLLSFAVFLGALTGLQLWLSSLIGGWLENWVVYNRIPEAVSMHYRLGKVLGHEKAQRIATWILDESSGIGSNISLAFLFGFSPLLGQLLGLNWNGHHVTISTASAFFAVSSLHFQISWVEVMAISTGLLLIGLMNFLVSFALALFVAANARRMKFWRMLYYLRISFLKKNST
jgi:site-specific recombinase